MAKKFEKKTTERKAPVIETYTKEFDAFVFGLTDLKEVNETCESILSDASNIDEATNRMVDVFVHHLPSIAAHENTLWSINVASTRCILKTDQRIAFGWKIKYEKDAAGDTVLTDIEFQVTLFGNTNDVVKTRTALENLGWVKQQ